MNSKKYTLYRLLSAALLCSSLFLTSCGKNSDEPQEPESAADRTVLLYMVGDNSLSYYCSVNMDSIMSGMKRSGPAIDFLVYEDSRSGKPTLWKMGKDAKGNAVKEKVQEFPEQNSVDQEVMADVINTVFAKYPSQEKGLILWSHATGWLPSVNYTRGNLTRQTFSFGQDGSNYMEIWELREVLENVPYLDFLIFDACHMASVEVVYELKEQTRYVISSPTEVMGSGFPYQTMVPILNKPKLDLKNVCQAYMDYYNGEGSYTEGAISLINTAALDELASGYAGVVSKSGDEMSALKSGSLQQFGRYVGAGADFRNIFFDLQDVVDKVSPDRSSDLKRALENSVLYKNNTTKFLGIPLERNCGLSVFVQELHENPTYQIAYTQLKWYQVTRF